MQTRFNALAVAVAALCLSTAVQAQNAFNTFGPGQSYMGGEEYVVEGSLSYNGPLWIAMEFTSAASGHLVNVTAPLDIYPPLVTTAKFTLLNDNGGTLGSEPKLGLHSIKPAAPPCSQIRCQDSRLRPELNTGWR